MRVAQALDALIARLQPRTPVDAGLAEAGLLIDDPLEAIVLRALALHGPQSPTDLAAFAAASPRPAEVTIGLRAIGDAIRRLHKRGHLEDTGDGRHRLAAPLVGRFGAFPRLAGAEHAEAPPIDLAAALATLPDKPTAARSLTGALLAAALAPAATSATHATPATHATHATPATHAPLDPTALDRQITALPAPARALLDWLADPITRPPLRATLLHAMTRVTALVDTALAEPLPPERAFQATWLTFITSIADLLPPSLLAHTPPRREELIRRWAWFVGCPITTSHGTHRGIEPPLISAAALARLDHRRLLADERALAVLAEAEAAATKLLDAERKRREEAARAYANGRRE